VAGSVAAAASSRAPVLERVAVISDVRHQAIGLRVTSGSGTAAFLFHSGDEQMRIDRDCTIGDYQTDARVFQYAAADDRLTSFSVVDATHALALRDGWISIAAGEPIADLSGILSDGTLDLHASVPPVEMRVHGGALNDVRRIRVNRRELPRGSDDTLTIASAAWGASVRDLLPHAPKAGRMDVFAV